MARKKDTNLTEVIHLRVTAKMKAFYQQYAKDWDSTDADVYRLALEMFIRLGGVDYKDKDN